MVWNPTQLNTVGHIPRETSRHAYSVLREENDKIVRSVYPMKYCASPIPARGLKIPLRFSFKSTRFITDTKMKDFITCLYSYKYDAEDEYDGEDDEEINFVIEDDDEVENEEPDTSLLIRPRMKRKYPVIDNEGKLQNTKPDESENISPKTKWLITKHLKNEMLEMKLSYENRKHYILESNTIIVVYLTHI